jgi:hypothetical protein
MEINQYGTTKLAKVDGMWTSNFVQAVCDGCEVRSDQDGTYAVLGMTTDNGCGRIELREYAKASDVERLAEIVRAASEFRNKRTGFKEFKLIWK